MRKLRTGYSITLKFGAPHLQGFSGPHPDTIGAALRAGPAGIGAPARFYLLPYRVRLRYNGHMETRQQRMIREIVDGPGESADTSLQRQAERHIDEAYVPRTLTPHEWEQWYATHGVPEGHRRGDTDSAPRPTEPSRWRRLLARLMPGSRSQ